MEGGGTLTYLADVHWGKSERLFAMVLLADGTHFWLCPAFEAGRARLQIDAPNGPRGEILAWQEHEHPYRPLASALKERRALRLAIEPSLRHGFVHELLSVIEGGEVQSGRGFVVALRARKDSHELAILRRANELTQVAIRAVARTLAPGMSGADIGRRMDRAHRRLGFTDPWNLSLIGAAAALPHGDPDAHPLARGDVVLIDTGGNFHGYQSDNTRTWVFDGTPAGTVLSAWNAVRDAQRRAFDALRPGLRCSEIDAIARARIDELGYGPGYRTFTHRLGHGIGVEGHEDPYFDGGSAVELAPGMTLSNEPGIYLPGEFGVRLEDIVAITEGGADHFGSWQKAPGSPD
jgi:Xaa-Pro dipeptidase